MREQDMPTEQPCSLEDYIAAVSENRRAIIGIMQQCHFTVERIKKGKQPAWRFKQDQGAFKGSTVYEVRQDQMDALWCINALQSEGFNFRDTIRDRLHSLLLDLFAAPEPAARPSPDIAGAEWQPIETAPKGPPLEFLCECSGYDVLAVWGPGSYSDEGDLFDDQTGDKVEDHWIGTPRYWRPHTPPALKEPRP